jgi:Chromo (CHRromatin Organisation MOdifier) domain
VERILDSRIVRKRQEYLISWKGCREEQRTWELAKTPHECTRSCNYLPSKIPQPTIPARPPKE